MRGMEDVRRAYNWLRRERWLIDVDEFLKLLDRIINDVLELADNHVGRKCDIALFEEDEFEKELIKRLMSWRHQFTYRTLIRKLIHLKKYIETVGGGI